MANSINPRRLRILHRTAGLIVAPFLLLQAVSGLFLSLGLYGRITSSLQKEAPPPITGAWNLLMAKLHFGPGMIGYIYHSLLVITILWIISSGLWIWIDMKRRQTGGN